MKNISILYIFLFLIVIISSKIQLFFTIKDENEYNEQNKNFKLKSFIDVPMGSEPDSKTLMKLCLGSPPQCFNLVVLTNSFYLMISNSNSQSNSQHFFNESQSNTLYKYSKFIELDYYDQKIRGQEAIDKLTINGIEISKIYFLLINPSGKYRAYDGFIGLGYMPNKHERKFSLIHQLFEKGKIAHKVFTQYYNDNYNGVITIGEIPDYIVEDYIHYGRCKALNKIRNGKEYKNNNWECNIDFIYYGDNNDMNNMIQFIENNYKAEVLFLSYRKRSFLPLFIFEIFEKTYFKRALYEKQCIINSGGKYRWYECDNNIQLPNLNLVFDAWEMRITSDKLFIPSKNNKNKKEFIFYYKEQFEKFLIGRSLLKEFEMVYDYANKQIGFYHPNVRYLGNEKIGPPKVYTFLEDDDEYKEKRINISESFLPEINPEENKNKYNPLPQEEKLNFSNILKIIFEILIIIVGIYLIGFLIIYGLKIRKKNLIKQTNLYLKKKYLIEMK